jgi:hypothetical protein
VRPSRIAIVVASALALTACGSGGGSSSSVSKTTVPVSRKIVLTSIVTTAAAKTARIELTVGISGGGSDNPGKLTADGAVDFGTGDSQLTMYFDGPLGSALSDGFETRTVDGVVYMRMPSGLAGIPMTEGKPWFAIDSSKFGGPGDSSPLDLSGQADPTKALAYLEKVSSDVREVGSDSIRGTDTTHYRATLDLAKSVDVNGKNVPPGLRDSVKQFAGLFGTIPADVWIDGDGRLRRLRIEIDFGKILRGLGAPGSQTDNAVMTETLDFYDFGAPVHIEAPPADQVAQLPNAGDFGALKIDANA